MPFSTSSLFTRPTVWPALLLASALLLPRLTTAQTYNNELVFTGPDDLVYEPGGIINDVDGVWTNQGMIVHDGPQELTFINRGVYTALLTGVDRFTAATSQIEIAGTTQPTFYDLLFENSGVVNLTNVNGARVTHSVTLSNTLVNNVAVAVPGALRFGPAGTYTWTTGPDDAHHVNGYVGKDGPTQFTYPVGSGTDYRYVRAATPNGMAIAFLASNPQGTVAFAPTLSKVFPTATWPVDAVAVGSAVTISMPNIPPAFAIGSKLRLVGWNGTQWIDLSGVPTATGVIEGSELSGTLVAGITALGIGAGPDPLPVELRGFAVKPVKTDAILDWSTVSERNSAYFQIERSIDAHLGFEAVGARVPAAGNSTVAHAYTSTDADVGRAGGTFYYRLRQVDTNGASVLSDVRTVTFGQLSGWTMAAWPNPTGGDFSAWITTSEAGAAVVQLYDMAGRLVQQRTPTLTIGTTQIPFQTDDLPNGTYVLRVTQGTHSTSIRLVRN